MDEKAKNLATVEMKLKDNEQDLERLREKERDLLDTNRQMSESLVKIQNEKCIFQALVKTFLPLLSSLPPPTPPNQRELYLNFTLELISLAKWLRTGNGNLTQ